MDRYLSRDWNGNGFHLALRYRVAAVPKSLPFQNHLYLGNLDSSLSISKIQILAKLAAKGIWAANKSVNARERAMKTFRLIL